MSDNHLKSVGEIQKKYNQTASRYSQREIQPFWIGFASSVMKKEIEELSPEVCFDIGCGSGGLVSQLAPLFPHIRFIGIDLSEGLIEIARERCRGLKNIEFHCGDFVQWANSEKMKTLEHLGMRVYVACIGPMEYFDERAEFTKSLKKTIEAPEVVGFSLTFHNRDFYGFHPVSENDSQIGKCHWAMKEACEFFCKDPDHVSGYYSQFRPLDFLACLFGINGLVMYYLDRAASFLLGGIRNGYFFPNFIISGRTSKLL